MAITVEIVRGKKEELYWEKVPEKIRRQAVQAAAGLTPASQAEGDGGTGKCKKRKRNN